MADMAAPSVLVLAADAALRKSISFALEVDGAQVQAIDRPALLGAAVQAAPDRCLLIDHDPPALDAIALIGALRVTGSTMPAIVMASAPGKRLRAKIRAVDAALIEKPLLCDVVTTTVRSLCRCPRPSTGRTDRSEA